MGLELDTQRFAYRRLEVPDAIANDVTASPAGEAFATINQRSHIIAGWIAVQRGVGVELVRVADPVGVAVAVYGLAVAADAEPNPVD